MILRLNNKQLTNVLSIITFLFVQFFIFIAPSNAQNSYTSLL